MIYQVVHTTVYEYSAPVSLCQNVAHLTPRQTAYQFCRYSVLVIDPTPAVLSSRTDYFGNEQTFFAVQEPHRTLTITASHTVEVAARRPTDLSPTLPCEAVRDGLRTHRDGTSLAASHFAFPSPHVPDSPAVAEYARPSFPPGRSLGVAVLDLTARIHHDFKYDALATTVSTPVDEVLQKRRGVCQDFSHLQLACLRSQGLAARYVSGYLRTTPPAGKPHLVGADATHAWLAVYDPHVGWFEVDPTNNLQPTDKHLVLGWGRDFDDVSPVKGVILGGEQHTVRVAVNVVEAGPGM
jgi:transglutaminase-like putative cysteine protease